MNSYLQNIIPRLKRHSRDLDKIENFIDKEWIYIDEHFNHHEYVFMRDKRLIMSVNGSVKTGSWELLPTGKLLIDRITDKVMLENMFIDTSLMPLRKSGSSEQAFILIDPLKIPEFNVQSYLEDKLTEVLENESISAGTIFLSKKGILHGATYFSVGEKVESFDGLLVSGTFEVDSEGSARYCVLKNGIISEFYYKRIYYLKDTSRVVVEQKFSDQIRVGDKIQNVNKLNLAPNLYFEVSDPNNDISIVIKVDSKGNVIKIKFQFVNIIYTVVVLFIVGFLLLHLLNSLMPEYF